MKLKGKEVTHKIEHAVWNGEIGNCISVPGFVYRIGYTSHGAMIKSIIYLPDENVIDTYKVFWQKLKTEITDHRS